MICWNENTVIGSSASKVESHTCSAVCHKERIPSTKVEILKFQ